MNLREQHPNFNLFKLLKRNQRDMEMWMISGVLFTWIFCNIKLVVTTGNTRHSLAGYELSGQIPAQKSLTQTQTTTRLNVLLTTKRSAHLLIRFLKYN